ncbi:TPA: glycosyltransferase family 2 protein, partial [Escherichia coli]
PLVSIITATYNSERFVLDTYNSIANQTYKNWEWLVTDDCSKDNTVELLKKLSVVDNRIKLYKNETNSGAAVSRNKCLENCKGDYIAFLDSDDIWMPDKIEKQLSFMGENIDFSFTGFEIMDENGICSGHLIDASPIRPLTYYDMLKKCATLGCSTVMLRARAFEKIEMPLLRTGQDYATWLALLKEGKKAYLIPETLTKYRIVKNSISRNKFKKACRQWEIYRRVEGINIIMTFYYFAHYAIKAMVR